MTLRHQVRLGRGAFAGAVGRHHAEHLRDNPHASPLISGIERSGSLSHGRGGNAMPAQLWAIGIEKVALPLASVAVTRRAK